MFRKLIYNAQNYFFYRILEYTLRDCRTVLDVGCGYDSSIGHIRHTFKSEGIEIYKKTLDLSRKRRLHDAYKLGDIRHLDRYYKKKSFDAVVCIDVIEHLDKPDALSMIKKMEKIAKKRVIVLTPNGYYHQDAYDGNPYQVHKSGWSSKDFRSIGYSVRGLRGMQLLRNENAGIRFKPYIIWGFITLLSELIFYPFPDSSFDIFATKEI